MKTLIRVKQREIKSSGGSGNNETLRNKLKAFPTAVAFISNFPSEYHIAERYQDELENTFVATYDNVMRVAYWAKILEINEEMDKIFPQKSFKLLDIVKDYVKFDCALPNNCLKPIQELEKFVKRFEGDFPELEKVYQYIQKITLPQSSLHFGMPDLNKNLANIGADISFWAHQLSAEKRKVNDIQKAAIREVFQHRFTNNIEFIQQVTDSFEIAERHAPVFLGILNVSNFARRKIFLNPNEDCLISEILKKEKIDLFGPEMKAYRMHFKSALAREAVNQELVQQGSLEEIFF